MPQTDTLKGVMDALFALEQTVHDDLKVYRWRPRAKPELPALWNWAPQTADFEQRDQAQHRDVFRISAYIGIHHSDSDEEMAALETYGDAFRAVVDPDFNRNEPLDGAVVWAKRSGQVPVLDEFPNQSVLCLELPMEFWVHRMLP